MDHGFCLWKPAFREKADQVRLGCGRRIRGQKHAPKMKSREIESKNNKTCGQWCCQKQTDWAPEPSPEESRYDNSQGGDARTASQNDRLDDVICKQLKQSVEQKS